MAGEACRRRPGISSRSLKPTRATSNGEQPVDIAALGAVAGAEIAIGPEGGFAPEELEAFQLAGFSRAALGPRVLRTETAAIAAIVVLQTRFGDMSAALTSASRTADS